MELFNVYSLYPIEPVRGKGCYVYDAAGTEYLDLYGGHAVISIGHAQPDYVRAVQEQVARLGFYSNSVENSLQVKLAERLGRISGYDDYRLFLCNSGAEANENALKLASFHTGRSKVLAISKEGSALSLDMDEAFLAGLRQSGSTGESMYLGSLVNTFLDNFNCETVRVTVEGKTFSTAHADYDKPLQAFTF